MRQLSILLLFLLPLSTFSQTSELILGKWINYPNTEQGTELTFVRPESLGEIAGRLNPSLSWEIEKYGLMSMERTFSNFPTKDGIREEPKPQRTIRLQIIDGDTIVVDDPQEIVYLSGATHIQTFYKLSEENLWTDGGEGGEPVCYRILSISATEMKLRQISCD